MTDKKGITQKDLIDHCREFSSDYAEQLRPLLFKDADLHEELWSLCHDLKEKYLAAIEAKDKIIKEQVKVLIVEKYRKSRCIQDQANEIDELRNEVKRLKKALDEILHEFEMNGGDSGWWYENIVEKKIEELTK